MTTPETNATPPASPLVGGGKGDLLSRVSIGRISEVIVEQVRLLIRQGQLLAGDRLPSERELCERFGVSRVTVREALRVLEANGLVEIRVGARGGAFVTAPSSRLVGEGIADLISLATLTAGEVTEARQVFELGIVGLVCERATDEDIAALYEICDRSSAALEGDDYPLELSAEWHSPVRAVGAQPRRRHARRVAARPAAHVAGEGPRGRAAARPARRRGAPLPGRRHRRPRHGRAPRRSMSSTCDRTAERVAGIGNGPETDPAA